MSSRRYSEDEFRAAVADPDVATIADLCRAIGIVPRGGNYETVRRYAAGLGLDLSTELQETARRERLGRDARAWRDVPDAEIAEAVRHHRSLAEAMRAVGFEPSSSGYRRVRRALERVPVDTDHLLGKGANLGRSFPERWLPPDEYFVRGKLKGTNDTRERLIALGLRERRCAGCGRDEWQGEPIPLELDHVDGDRWNNTLENLRLLCPNCHAQTPTYRGRNIGNGYGPCTNTG